MFSRLVLLLLLALSGMVEPASADEVRESKHLLGSIVEILVEAPDPETGQYWIDQAMEVGRRLELVLREDDERSELARLNQQAGQGTIRVPPDLYRMLAVSQLLARMTGGAYDPTVGAVLRARSAAAELERETDDDAIDAALGYVGYDRLLLHPPDGAELTRAGMAVDFGAVARGYAAARMAARLRQLGVKRSLVHFGNSIFSAIGPPREQPPWRISVPRGGGIAGTVALRDHALAITHSLRRDDDLGSHAAHVTDPRSGRLVEANRQAAVLALDAAIAAGWSTAMIVDPDGVVGLLESPRDVEAIGFDEHGEHRTPRFDTFADWEPARRTARSETGEAGKKRTRPRDEEPAIEQGPGGDEENAAEARKTPRRADEPREQDAELRDLTAEPSDRAAEPPDQAAEPPDQAVEPSDQAVEPSDQVVEPSDQVAEPSDQVAEPSDQAAEPSDQAAEPRDQAAEPRDQAAEPRDEAAEPSDRTAEPRGQDAEPNGPAAEPRDPAAEPSSPPLHEEPQ